MEEGNKDKLDPTETKFEGVGEVSNNRKFIKALDRRRIKFIGHVLRNKEFVINIIEGKVLNKENTRQAKEVISCGYQMLYVDRYVL